MLLSGKLAYYQPLIIQSQLFLADPTGIDQAAAPWQRLQEQVHLRVMAKGFKVADPHHRLANSLPVDDLSLGKSCLHAEAVPDQPSQDLRLHLSHELHVDLVQLLLPQKLQLRLFLLQAPELQIGFVNIRTCRQIYPVA